MYAALLVACDDIYGREVPVIAIARLRYGNLGL
jgi:hypothetical protein